MWQKLTKGLYAQYAVSHCPHNMTLPEQLLAQHWPENVDRIQWEAVFNDVPMQYKSALFYLSERGQEAHYI